MMRLRNSLPMVSVLGLLGWALLWSGSDHAYAKETEKKAKVPEAAAEVPDVERNDYYEVEGASVREILDSMASRRPFAHNAYTEWYVSWDYQWDLKPGSVELTGFDTRVDVRYTLPRLVEDKKRPRRVQREWERYMKALILHEDGHGDLGRKAGREIREAVLAKKWSGKDRKEVKAKIDALAQSVLETVREEEREYDRKTDHGRTQGARLK